MAHKKTKSYTTVDQDGEIVHTVLKNNNKKKKYYIPSEYFNLGMYFLIPILASLFVGMWLDERFDKKGFFTILLLTLGVLSAFYNLYKLYKQDESAH